LVQIDKTDKKAMVGIIIPDTAKDSPQRGTILAIGNGLNDKPMTLKVGDSVLFGKYTGTRVIVEGVDALIMKESDIFGVIYIMDKEE
jgi:chaperonin GroES